MSPKKILDEGAPTDAPIQESMTPPAGAEEALAEPTPPEEPSGSLALTARQFVRAKGYRWERSAGFLLEQGQAFGREARLTLAEWQPHWDAFWQRPVK